MQTMQTTSSLFPPAYSPATFGATAAATARPQSAGGLRRRRSAAGGLVRGLAGGIVATAAMSAVMLAAQKSGLLGHMPPKKITDGFLGALGIRRETPEPARKALATLNHFAFGGVCGALFGLAREMTRGRRSGRAPVLAGVAYGTAIWAVSYAGWVPALGIMPRPKHDRPGRPTSMVLAHWVFGAVLAKTVG
jgi:hypothetical protein